MSSINLYNTKFKRHIIIIIWILGVLRLIKKLQKVVKIKIMLNLVLAFLKKIIYNLVIFIVNFK